MADPTTSSARQRSTRTILAAIALGSTSLYTAFTASVLVATDLGASPSWVGTPGAASVIGTALGAAWLSQVMARKGRRLGLTWGWAVGTVGAILAIAAVVAGSFAGLILAMIPLGIGHASNQLSRFAAADMHPVPRRPTIVGFAVWAGTIGAVAGPSLLGPGEYLAEGIGLTQLASGFLIALVFYVFATACALTLKPDPSELAVEESVDPAYPATSLKEHRRSLNVRTAMVVLVTGQLVMTGIMTMTPFHVREHGHGVGVIGLVMSAHFLGMFALAPVIGAIAARLGSIKVATAGLVTIVVAAVGAALSPDDTGVWIGAALFLLGLGWCMGFVAGSALLAHGLGYADRVRLQGGVDVVVWTGSAFASLAAGWLVGSFNYVTLALVGGAAVLLPLVFVAMSARRLRLGFEAA